MSKMLQGNISIRMKLILSGCLFLCFLIGIHIAFTKDNMNETNGNKEKTTKDIAYFKDIYYIKVNKMQNVVIIYGQDDNNSFSIPLKEMICSTGETTPLGSFQITDKYPGFTTEDNVWVQYTTKFNDSFGFHSTPYTDQNNYSLKTEDYNKLGSQITAGGIQLTVADSKWISDNCKQGTVVEIVENNEKLPMVKPKAIKVPEYTGWDPTDTDINNPWKKSKTGTISVNSSVTMERGKQLNYLSNVVAMDKENNDITTLVKYEETVDINAVGTYQVDYTYTDEKNNLWKSSISYIVVDTTPPVLSGMTEIERTVSRSKINDVDKRNEIVSYLRNNVSSNDLGEAIDPNSINIVIPDNLVEGSNTYYYEVTDAYGNKTQLNGILTMNLVDDPTVKEVVETTEIEETTEVPETTTQEVATEETTTGPDTESPTIVYTSTSIFIKNHDDLTLRLDTSNDDEYNEVISYIISEIRKNCKVYDNVDTISNDYMNLTILIDIRNQALGTNTATLITHDKSFNKCFMDITYTLR